MGAEAVPAIDISGQVRPWWERRWFLALVVLATMVPLIYPQFPPFVDLPGHLGHYRVELDVGHSPSLGRYYGFHWAPIGNLGVDLSDHSTRQAVRPGARGEADRARHPAADRDRNAMGCTRGARSSAADGPLRAAVHLRCPVPVRLPQLLRCPSRSHSLLSPCGCGLGGSIKPGSEGGCSRRSG